MLFRGKKDICKPKRKSQRNKLEGHKIISIASKFLATEMRENYISISNGITRISYEIYEINKHVKKFFSKNPLNKEELINRFWYLILEMYIFCGDAIEYQDLNEKIFTSLFVKTISSKYFDEEDVNIIMANFENSIKNIKNVKVAFCGNNTPFERGEKGGFIEVFKNLEGMDIDYILLGFIYNRYDRNISKFNEKWIILGQNILNFAPNESMQEFAYFIIQFGYAYIFMCYIILLRRYKCFSGNDELMLVLNELKSGNKSFFEVIPDFYLTYSSLYKNSFNMSFTLDEVSMFVLKDENEKKGDLFRQCDYYKNQIHTFKIERDFEKLIQSIDKTVFLKCHKEKDHYIERNEKYLCNELFDYLMIKVMDFLNPGEFLKIISFKTIYVNKLINKN
ncbi:hypothetical protein [Intestinibacter bartlettii]|uniref:Uncharacterized protein n=1 Tax=Intestinibacter bartlettii TaxID=261299 RepID=A0ABS6DXW0_9FIRM|nr:hypothetical protein [Intestinibacter bartlettii]MBU5336686.1 hypothetical protein [Intestinibacter bartlettii]